jgi:hypothetical protein
MSMKRKAPLEAWEIQRILKDSGFMPIARDSATQHEIDRRIFLGTGGEPLFALENQESEASPEAKAALASIGVFMEALPEGEYFLETVSTEPDVEYLQNRKRGQFAQSSGAYAEEQFRAWCRTKGYLYLQMKYLSGYLELFPRQLPPDFWLEFERRAKLVKKRNFEAIEKYTYGKDVGMYGNIAGFADFFVIQNGKKKDQFFVEVKVDGRVKLSDAQLSAIRFFERHGIRTEVWRAHSKRFDSDIGRRTSNKALLPPARGRSARQLNSGGRARR